MKYELPFLDYTEGIIDYLDLNACLPIIISPNKRKSQAIVKNGYCHVEGLFLSKNKWPIQAKPKATKGIAIKK